MPPFKVSRGAGGVRISGTPKEVTSRDTSQLDQTSTPHLFCAYCGKTNHTEDNCWRKTQKCLKCGSTEHQIANCPLISDTQSAGKSNPKPTNVGGTRSRVPARVYSLDQQSVPELTEVVEGTIRVFHCLTKF